MLKDVCGAQLDNYKILRAPVLGLNIMSVFCRSINYEIIIYTTVSVSKSSVKIHVRKL